MATKSILKQLVIESNDDWKNFANALEEACDKKAKVLAAPKPRIASVDDAKKILAK